MKKLLTIAALASTCAIFAGCAGTTPSQQQQIQTLANLGTTGALLASPQYRPAIQQAASVLTMTCDTTNINASSIEQLLAQNGVTNKVAEIGIAPAVDLADLFAQNQLTNGIPLQSSIAAMTCPISAGMNQALTFGGKRVVAPPKKHWYYLWLK